MRKFLSTIFKFYLAPIIVLVIVVILWDPFKVFFKYSEYISDSKVNCNREIMCLELLNQSGIKNKHNFIIGSSRSQAFKTTAWAPYIDCSANSCFHYDGSGMGLYRATNAIKYLTKSCDVKNMLLIMDTDFFVETTNPDLPLFIQPPTVSHQSRLKFYSLFVRASLDPYFLASNITYKLSGKYFDFMGSYIAMARHPHTSVNNTGDVYYGYDQDIASDSIGYYSKLIKKDIFYSRKKNQETSPILINEKQKSLIKEIASEVQNHKIAVKIIISPLYSQIKMNPDDLQYLKQLFGDANVFDFSGINQYTENPFDYYESSHFKPYVANRLMQEVYSTSSENNNHLAAN